ncbi:hypothetical protein HY249_02695 [Candidatus Azambacteria bacterium]|nr:hypothetical protein [Candidatus Azambacteria bacterium]
MKKIITTSIILIILTLVISAACIYFYPLKTVHNNGFAFSYPKNINFQAMPYYAGNYKSYKIENNSVDLLKRSTIDILIPIGASLFKI